MPARAAPPPRPPSNPPTVDHDAALAELDREWADERATLMVRGKGGAPTEPSVLRAALAAAVGVGGAVFAYLMAANSGLPAALVFGLPLAFAALGLWTAGTVLAQTRRWTRAEADYRRRRAEIERGGET